MGMLQRAGDGGSLVQYSLTEWLSEVRSEQICLVGDAGGFPL